MQVFLIFYVLGLDICVVAIESIFWFECDVPFTIFYIVCVVTTMIIGTNIGTQDTHLHPLNIKLEIV
jgi:ABC-type methionine transport system permease subunit